MSSRKYPRQLMLELSRECNMKCAGCYHENIPGEMSVDIFTQILSSIAREYRHAREELPILCPWFYSEPMMIRNLSMYLRIASGLGYKINLTTNGLIWNQWESIIQPDINLHLVVFSIDGETEETYHAIRNHPISSVIKTLAEVEAIIEKTGIDAPLCIKLTRKGIEWAEVTDFVARHLADPYVKMVAVSDAFDTSDGPKVARHECRYLPEYFIIQHDLTVAPCCMRWKGICKGMGKVNIDNPMEAYFSEERELLQYGLEHNEPVDYCRGCLSSYTGSSISGAVDGAAFGKARDVLFKRDFYNTFYFNPDYY